MVEAKILQIDGKAAPRLINDTEAGQSEWNRAAVNFFKRLTSRVVLEKKLENIILLECNCIMDGSLIN